MKLTADIANINQICVAIQKQIVRQNQNPMWRYLISSLLYKEMDNEGPFEYAISLDSIPIYLKGEVSFPLFDLFLEELITIKTGLESIYEYVTEHGRPEPEVYAELMKEMFNMEVDLDDEFLFHKDLE